MGAVVTQNPDRSGKLRINIDCNAAKMQDTQHKKAKHCFIKYIDFFNFFKEVVIETVKNNYSNILFL
jgi:hypothetical protein